MLIVIVKVMYNIKYLKMRRHMSYISAIVPSKSDNIVLAWERDENGERHEREFKAPYYFYIDDPNGKYTTIFDTKVKKIDCGNNRGKFYTEKKKYQDRGIKTWESDISPELRVLSSEYYNVPAPKLNVTHLDIENDYSLEKGFSGPKNPYAPINAIALFHEHTQTMVALATPHKDDPIIWTNELLEKACNDILPIPTDYKMIFKVCKDEAELLNVFLDEIQDSDLLVGWNSTKFDFPFIGKRIEIVLGRHALRGMSFIGAEEPKFTEVEEKGKFGIPDKNAIKQTYIRLDLSGRMLADYMELYKKYEMSEKPSYKLSTVSEDVLVDDDDVPLLPKLEYDGTLFDLYLKNFAFFVRYNIRDTEILHGFEQKLAYVELANQMYHLSCAKFEHVGGTLKLAELAIVNHCHHVINRVVNNVTRPDIDQQIEGALVLLPQTGMHEYIGSIDVTSLYPTGIRSLNMSTEKIRGQFIEKEIAHREICKQSETELTLILEKTGEEITATAAEWKDFLLVKKWAISGYGTIFDQDNLGIIPTVLTDWFAQRKLYQKKKKEAEQKMSELIRKYKSA